MSSKISLLQFTPQSEEGFRHEKKYILPDSDPSQVELMLKLHPGIFREIYHQRMVNNIYFDDQELNDYYDNIVGAPERKKVRLRWYGSARRRKYSATPEALPQLEIKHKQGEAVKKVTYSVTDIPEILLKSLPPEIRTSLQLENFRTKQRNTEHDSTQAYLTKIAHLQPSLFNTYQRRYFLSADGKIRATLDWGLEFRAINTHRFDKTFAIQPELTIFELKSAISNTAELMKTAKHFPFFRQRLSKYALGVSSLETHDY